MKLFFILAFVCFWASVYAAKNTCSYDYCHKDELSGCRKDEKLTREQCNNQGGLYVTFRKGTFSGSEHACCNWKMKDIPNKYLYCVRNIRGPQQLCTSDSIDYKVKIKTLQQCNTLSCT